MFTVHKTKHDACNNFPYVAARLINSFYIALLFIKDHHSLIVGVIKVRNQYVITIYEASKVKYSLSSVGSWTLINQIVVTVSNNVI